MLSTLFVASVALTLTVAPPDQQPERRFTIVTHIDPASSAALTLLLDEHYEERLRADPVMASLRGDLRYNDRLEDLSPEAIAARLAFARDRLARLNAINREALTAADRLNFDLLHLSLSRAIDGAAFHQEQIPFDDRFGPQIDLPQLPDRLPLDSDRLLADYAARIEAMPRLIEQTIALARAGLASKRVPPKVCVAHVLDQVRRQCTPALKADPTASAIYRPFLARPEGDAIAARARAATAKVVEAFASLADFLEKDYLPACRDSIAAKDSVDGLAYYQFQLREQTTTDLTPEQVHALGLKEVARIRDQMQRVIARSDFATSAAGKALQGEALFEAFTHYLRTDPRFYCTSEDELLRTYRDIAKRIDAELPRLFATLPRTPYGIRAIPRFAAESSPTAYYYHGSLRAGLAGYFMANTYRLDQRPKYEMIALTLHEAMPGHHLERALADELQGQHPLRSLMGFTAFVEGWGLYAERLGMEMEGPLRRESAGAVLGAGSPGDDEIGRGLYKDPYDDFGRLSYEMWRALRLVVDTGIHAQGWSRDQAIAYMEANSALSRYNIEREVDRYIAWPGQACAYKLGELKIRELRARAEQALGDHFDLRAFHDALLAGGPVPLRTLEDRIDLWVSSQQHPAPEAAPAPKRLPPTGD